MSFDFHFKYFGADNKNIIKHENNYIENRLLSFFLIVCQQTRIFFRFLIPNSLLKTSTFIRFWITFTCLMVASQNYTVKAISPNNTVYGPLNEIFGSYEMYDSILDSWLDIYDNKPAGNTYDKNEQGLTQSSRIIKLNKIGQFSSSEEVLNERLNLTDHIPINNKMNDFASNDLTPPKNKNIFTLYNRCSNKHVQIIGRRVNAKASPFTKQKLKYAYLYAEPTNSTAIRIRSQNTGFYICFNRRGKLLARVRLVKNLCLFSEHYDNHNIKYRSIYNITWYMGFDKNGHPLPGVCSHPINTIATETVSRECYSFKKRIHQNQKNVHIYDSHKIQEANEQPELRYSIFSSLFGVPNRLKTSLKTDNTLLSNQNLSSLHYKESHNTDRKNTINHMPSKNLGKKIKPTKIAVLHPSVPSKSTTLTHKYALTTYAPPTPIITELHSRNDQKVQSDNNNLIFNKYFTNFNIRRFLQYTNNDSLLEANGETEIISHSPHIDPEYIDDYTDSDTYDSFNEGKSMEKNGKLDYFY